MPSQPLRHAPSERTLDELELMRLGGCPSRFGLASQGAQPGLVIRGEVAPEVVELTDPEGAPLARVRVEASEPAGGGVAVAGAVEHTGAPGDRPFESLYRPAGELAATPVAALTGRPLTTADLDVLAGRERVRLLVSVGEGARGDLTAAALIRATRAALTRLEHVEILAVPITAQGNPQRDVALRAAVIQAFAPGAQVLDLPGAGECPPAVQRELARPAVGAPGAVVLFSGLSGSGKSTVARALMNHVAETGERRVTSLDGDVVRRHLSAGLGFSPADRETNIRRIGWVAAQIAHHGGLAVCSPIAPFAATRKEMRAMAAAAGAEFVLVHVATPLAECERRDRKGLYARARAGEIPDFTGISSPYEVPDDADVTIDTTAIDVPTALAPVLSVLHARGILRG